MVNNRETNDQYTYGDLSIKELLAVNGIMEFRCVIKSNSEPVCELQGFDQEA